MHTLALAVREMCPAGCGGIVHVVMNRIRSRLIRACVHRPAFCACGSEMNGCVFDLVSMSRVAGRIVALLEGVKQAKPVSNFVD